MSAAKEHSLTRHVKSVHLKEGRRRLKSVIVNSPDQLEVEIDPIEDENGGSEKESTEASSSLARFKLLFNFLFLYCLSSCLFGIIMMLFDMGSDLILAADLTMCNRNDSCNATIPNGTETRNQTGNAIVRHLRSYLGSQLTNLWRKEAVILLSLSLSQSHCWNKLRRD